VNAKFARAFVVAGTLALALALALSACGAKSDGTTGSAATTGAAANSAPAADPTKDLLAALVKSAGQSFTFTLGDSTDSFNGVFDSSNGGIHLADPTDKSSEITVIGADSWALVDPDTYAHFDALKFAKGSPLVVLVDPTAAVRWLQSAHDVKLITPGTYEGSFDLTKVTGADAATKHLSEILAQAVGTEGRSLPFTVKVDESGKLASFKTTLPKLDDGKDAEYVFTVTKYGAVTPVKKPTGKIIEAPAEAYAAK
jgi:hypothetical protein